MASQAWDVIIVGGGPAGLNAALLLGRCRRRVLVLDQGEPRNAASQHAHGVFTRDGEHPAELLRIAREQLAPYDVEVQRECAVTASRKGALFELVTASGARHRTRKLLLATGMSDQLPEIPGVAACYGRSVFHCPYCDGWELRDQPLAVLGHGHAAVDLALGLTTWSSDIVLCTNGSTRMSRTVARRLRAHDIVVNRLRVQRLEHEAGRLQRLVFEDDSVLDRVGLFVSTKASQRCDLARTLGCQLDTGGAIQTGALAQAGKAGLYVAGDAAREVHFVGVAAAEGLKAAYAINRALREERSAALLAQLAD